MRRFYILTLFTIVSTSIHSQWINEFHYDNSGSDVNEGVEIAGPSGTSLACYQIVLYNGNGGGSYSTTALSGTIPDEGCGYGAIWFSISGLQNGSPDGIALNNTCTNTLIEFISYEGAFTASNGPANGVTSTDVGVTESSSSSSSSSIQLTGAGASSGDFSWSGPSANSHGLLNSGQSISPCGGGGSVTVTSGIITGSPFSVDCATPANGTITFSSTGTFNSGNIFTAELSDASGNFSSPISVGTLSGAGAEGTDPSGTINISIPAATASGSGYLIRITSSSPSSTSSNSTGLTITLTGSCDPPYITSVIINSCNGTCGSEGYNELVFGNTGGYSVNVTPANFNFFYGSSSPASTNYTDVLVTNPTTTAAINTDAGCAGTFVEGTGATMPPNSKFILASDNVCIDALTWAGLCGQGPIYIIYQNDPNWSTSGNFSNSTSSGTRYFRSQITTTSGDTYTIDYNYNRPSNSGTDGDFVTYAPSGGAPQTYGDNDCALTPIVLPVELYHFAGEKSTIGNNLIWTTSTERNSGYFILERSADGQTWSAITEIAAAGNSASSINYQFIDNEIENVINYYRLKQVDLDGLKQMYPHVIALDNRLQQNGLIIERYNLIGQPVDSSYSGVQLILYENGYIQKIVRP